ncbi:hypothetical protein C8Q73DRAFT_35535 [Cubamyces lactineus]|nr:hypothetical protein C8Q73DRAFT_35535 [Cubamyces lactineus]
MEVILSANEKGNLDLSYLARGASTSSSHSLAMSPTCALSPTPLSPSLLSPAGPSPTSATALLPATFNDAMSTPPALSPSVISPAATFPTDSSLGPSPAMAFSRTPSSPIVASPATAPARRFRGAWDDPPPTPEYRPLSLQMNEVASFVRPGTLDPAQSIPPADANEASSAHRNPAFRDSVLGDGRSETEGDQLPEYSRY